MPQAALPLLATLLMVLPTLMPWATPLETEPAAPLLPDFGDISDGDLAYLLARNMGLPVERRALVGVPADATIPTVALRLAERAGLNLEPQDAAALGDVHPLVAAPVLSLMVAMDHAWQLRDDAFAALTIEEQRELAQLSKAQAYGTPRYEQLRSEVNRTMLVESGILLLDTLDQIVVPALKLAIDQGVWTPIAVADPVGVLRLGSSGDDHETVDRILQIDPSGNDVYENNAGATRINDILWDPVRYRNLAVSVSIDFAGNDVYTRKGPVEAQGAAVLGVGVLLDFWGNDHYQCGEICQGSSGLGFGYMREHSGADTYRGRIVAGGGDLLGIFRDDAGNDHYSVADSSGGYSGHAESTGLLWDRAGSDRYESYEGLAVARYGWAYDGGRGWMVDEGPDADFYWTENHFDDPHGCNNCVWTSGRGRDGAPSNGRGVDNAGGLPYLLRDDDAVL